MSDLTFWQQLCIIILGIAFVSWCIAWIMLPYEVKKIRRELEKICELLSKKQS